MSKPASKLLSAREIIQIRGLTPRSRDAGAIRAQWYEGSRWSPNRAWIWQPVQDAKKDLDRFTRWELNKAGEKLWKDSPFIRGLIKRIVTLVIGTGAYPTPKTSSPEFNKELKAFLCQKFRRPCIDNKKSFANYQRKKLTGMLKHGESFTVFVTDPVSGQDKIQGFEWHRCTAAGGKPAKKKESLYQGNDDSFSAKASDKQGGGDGIDFYETGFPKQYNFLGMDAPVPESLVVHHALIERDEQVRGETILAAAINHARDIHDIIALEKMAVKDASSRQDIIQTMSGEYDPETMLKLPFGNAGDGNFPTPMSLPKDDTAKNEYYDTKFQGGAVLLKTGDKYTPYIPNRPGNAWEGFMAFLSNVCVLSTGLPPSLVLPIDIGGTDIRRDLQIAQKLIEIWQSELSDDFQEIAEFFIHGGIEDRVFKSKIPPDWNALEWHFTGSLTVDRNRDSQRKELVEAGLMTRNEYFGESGQDSEEQMRLVISEAKKTRFLITGQPETEPFDSAAEFKQFLSLSEMVSFRETMPVTDDSGNPPPAPGKKKITQQPQPA